MLLSFFARSTWRSASRLFTKALVRVARLLPPDFFSICALSSSSNVLFMRARRTAMDEMTSGSVLPRATACSSLSKGTRFLLVHRAGVGLVLLADADGIDDDEWSLALASG